MEQATDMQPQSPSLSPALQQALSLLAPFAMESAPLPPRRLDVVIPAGELPAALQALMDAQWGYLAALTGVDLGPEAGFVEAIYFLSAGADLLWLRVRVPRDNAALPTICGVIPSASFYERELSEMLGVTVRDTPDPRPLFLPETWPPGVYPLRKDFEPADIQQAGEEQP